MSTLLLRLSAPLQSWGADSKFEIRRTGREPTKSGVVGMLAAALGRRRDESVNDLNALRFGVRVDQEGELLCDYHTVNTDESVRLPLSYLRFGKKTDANGNVKLLLPGKPEDKPYVTRRYYLSDAIFLAGLESDDEAFIKKLEYVICHPYYPLFLGKRSCPPTFPLCLGIRELPLYQALENEPWLAEERRQKSLMRKSGTLRIITDAPEGESSTARQRDMAVSFSSYKRLYEYRAISERKPKILNNTKTDEPAADDGAFDIIPSDHDPLSEL